MIKLGRREKEKQNDKLRASQESEPAKKKYRHEAQNKQDENRYAELRDKGRISARIIDVSSGLKSIEGVYAVRIHSAGFTALIMNDYIPALGKIDGDVTFLSQDGEYPYYDIRGFYKHQHNEFTLLIEEHVEEHAT